jgi:hypothetical protein
MEKVLDSLEGKLAIEDKLRHIVPPQVRVMQNELKTEMQKIINTQFEAEQKTEVDQKKFLQ